jgi:hypothetical protein
MPPPLELVVAAGLAAPVPVPVPLPADEHVVTAATSPATHMTPSVADRMFAANMLTDR